MVIKCNEYQLYKDDLVDLLRPEWELPRALDVCEDAKTGLIELKGAFEVKLFKNEFLAPDGPTKLIRAINRGLDNRHMRETAKNEFSSRSHLLISLVLVWKKKNAPL